MGLSSRPRTRTRARRRGGGRGRLAAGGRRAFGGRRVLRERASRTRERREREPEGRTRLQSERFDSSSSPPVWGPPPTHRTDAELWRRGGLGPRLSGCSPTAPISAYRDAAGFVIWPTPSQAATRAIVGIVAVGVDRHQAPRSAPLLRPRPRADAPLLHRQARLRRDRAQRAASSSRRAGRRSVGLPRRRRAVRHPPARRRGRARLALPAQAPRRRRHGGLRGRGHRAHVRAARGARRHAHHRHPALPRTTAARWRCSRSPRRSATPPSASSSAAATRALFPGFVPCTRGRRGGEQPLRLPAHRPRHVELPDHEAGAAVDGARAGLRAVLGDRSSTPTTSRRRQAHARLGPEVGGDVGSGVGREVRQQRAVRARSSRSRRSTSSTRTTAATACSTRRWRWRTSSARCAGCARAASSSCRRPGTLLRHAAGAAGAASASARSTRDIDVLRELEILVDGERAPRVPAADLPQGGGGPATTIREAGPFFFEIIQRKGDRGLRRRQLPRAVREHRARAARAGRI